MRRRGVLAGAEVAGLRLFVGRANCTKCHNGPLFTNNEFHNAVVPDASWTPIDAGRLAGDGTCAGRRIQLPQPVERRNERSAPSSSSLKAEGLRAGAGLQDRRCGMSPSARRNARRPFATLSESAPVITTWHPGRSRGSLGAQAAETESRGSCDSSKRSFVR